MRFWQAEFYHALAQAGLNGSGEAHRRAWFHLALCLGHCRLEGIDLGVSDGSVTPEQAGTVGQELLIFLRREITQAEALPSRLARADWVPEGMDLCFSLLEGRMDAWALFVAFDEGYQGALEDRSPLMTSLRPLMKQVLDLVARLDHALHEQLVHLKRIREFPYLKNCRTLLCELYSQALPWWLREIDAHEHHSRPIEENP